MQVILGQNAKMLTQNGCKVTQGQVFVYTAYRFITSIFISRSTLLVVVVVPALLAFQPSVKQIFKFDTKLDSLCRIILNNTIMLLKQIQGSFLAIVQDWQHHSQGCGPVDLAMGQIHAHSTFCMQCLLPLYHSFRSEGSADWSGLS